MKTLPIFIITGLSGSGKSTALAALEDVGFYCVDNMPIDLLPKFLELPVDRTTKVAGCAFVMDLREKGFPEKYDTVLTGLRQKGFAFRIIFLEAEETVLVQRFSATRRQHPLAHDQGIVAAIQSERERLKPLRDAAERVIDSSRLTVHELKAEIVEIARAQQALAPMQITVQSFGFKYGLPPEADLVVDVRFLPNPYFVAELKHLDGEAAEIREFIFAAPEARSFVAKYAVLLDTLIPLYEREGKTNLTIAVGCTGGRHRSVAIARNLFDRLAAARERVGLIHRDIHQPT
ncbi:MAG: RNase adapter RapZ [Desulfobacterales bacterium]